MSIAWQTGITIFEEPVALISLYGNGINCRFSYNVGYNLPDYMASYHIKQYHHGHYHKTEK